MQATDDSQNDVGRSEDHKTTGYGTRRSVLVWGTIAVVLSVSTISADFWMIPRPCRKRLHCRSGVWQGLAASVRRQGVTISLHSCGQTL